MITLAVRLPDWDGRNIKANDGKPGFYRSATALRRLSV